MAKSKQPEKKPIEQYDHKDKERLNNPPVGLVNADRDKETTKKKYEYDPHLDPQLVWAGKKEHTSFEVPTVSLHVHERIDPRTIIEAVKKKNGNNGQISLFTTPEENPPLREAIEFYKHRHNWSNRLVAGDSLLVMNSLLEKEGMAGKVQMIYIDPPYGIKYGSNFQPFTTKKEVKDCKDEDLTQEPEMIKAFRDTWELGIHSYLAYLRDRLLLAKELLTESGSVFVQISDENVHLVRNLMDEIFGVNNFVNQITIKRASVMFAKKLLNNAMFYVLFYSKDKDNIKYRQLYYKRSLDFMVNSAGSHLRIESPDCKISRALKSEERENIQETMNNLKNWKLYRLLGVNAQGTEKQEGFEFKGKIFYPPKGTQWKTSYEGLKVLKEKNRLEIEKNSLSYKTYLDDFPAVAINDIWEEIGPASDKVYVVQTPYTIIQRCLLMTTDPGDLVLDPTCGSGTTAYVAEQWGRRWITCDTSRVAITLAKQRLMTSVYDYYELARPEEGVSSGFKYKTVPHITLKSIANNEPAEQETLYDQPYLNNKKVRISGPFTVEAVPSPVMDKENGKLYPNIAKPLTEITDNTNDMLDTSIAREGESLRHDEWKVELLKTGIRGKGGQKIEFVRVETITGTHYLHCEAETKEDNPKRVVISFGPEHSPLEQRQVELALNEAEKLRPRPELVVFMSFHFDPEASKDIDETKWEGVTLLKVQMNTDLLTDDLKKKRSSNESFWLIGQPDIKLEKIKSGENKGKFIVEILGFDYYNTKDGIVVSGGTEKIAMWLLDTDYDGRSLFPKQVFFPMSGEKDGWSKLAKNLKAEIDEELIEAYRGTVSLPFEVGKYKRIAVKIVDDRGIESLKIVDLEG